MVYHFNLSALTPPSWDLHPVNSLTKCLAGFEFSFTITLFAFLVKKCNFFSISTTVCFIRPEILCSPFFFYVYSINLFRSVEIPCSCQYSSSQLCFNNMATAANTGWKLDDGTGFAVNCFPARGINRGTHEGSGSWIVAYAHQQQSKLRDIFKPFAQDQPDSSQLTGTILKEYSKQLTTGFLINHHHVDSANDLCSVNICDCELECDETANFAQFHNVAYINAAENLLSLRPFSTFPNLRELELAVNGIRGIDIRPGDFPNLQVLDLSYNNLSSTDVLSLGFLPKLKVLNITGNGLSQIHPDLSQPYTDNNEESHVRFQNLEVLLLDDNHLNDISIFAALAALPSLKELNLDKNNITLVPYLKVVGEKVLSETHSVHPSRSASGRKSNTSRSSSKKTKRSIKDDKGNVSPKLPSSPNPDTDSKKMNNLTQSESSIKTEHINKSTNPDDNTAIPTDFSMGASTSNPPFPHLKILSLANNKISEEEHLLAVAAWPALQALILHGNPLITNGKGEPPLLSHYLKKRLGISIIRFKPKAPVVKPPLRVPSQERRKISTHVPKIPKQPIDMMLEALRKPAVEPPLHCPIETKSSDSTKLTFVSDVPDGADQDNVFLTQVEDNILDEGEEVRQTVPASKQQNVESESKPETMEDVLKGAVKDPDIYEDLSIQGNVKMLRQFLHNPLSVTTVDPVPENRLNKFQFQGKSIVTVERMNKLDLRPLPRPNIKQIRHRKIEDTLSWMKHRTPATLELPLIDALNHPQDRELRAEADNLLSEITSKYRVVREESLKASRQARRAVDMTTAELDNLKSSL